MLAEENIVPEPLPDLSEQIRRELERITNLRGVVLNFDDEDDEKQEEEEYEEEEEEDENTIHLTATVEENTLTLVSSALPSDWGQGKEILLNGVRFVPATSVPDKASVTSITILTDKSNLVSSSPVASPASRKSPKRQEKENVVPVTPLESEPADEKIPLRRRGSQDLTGLVSPDETHSGFLAKLTRHGTYVDRWCELDPQTKSFNYWKTRTAKGVSAPTSLAVADIISVEWNAKDIKEGKRRNIIGMGGARFVITSKHGNTTWRAKDPLVTLHWITGIQDMLDEIEQPAIHVVPSEATLVREDLQQKCGMLQRMNAAGRYKDRWCELDPKKKTLSYWAKKSHYDSKAGPKGVVDFEQVGSIVWNPEDVRKGKRRSLLSKDGVRFSLVFRDNSAQNWRSNNPLDASEWSKVMGAVQMRVTQTQKA